MVRDACGAWLDKENTKTNRTNHQRYGLVLGILGSIDPLEAERKLSENRSEFKFNGQRINSDYLDNVPRRPNGKIQSAAEIATQMVTRLAGTRYSGRTEKERQDYYKLVRDKDRRREVNAPKASLQQSRDEIHSPEHSIPQKNHGKH